MTPRQILDSFSNTLMQDERILSAQERALLTALLQHAGATKAVNEQTRDAVRTVIASAVGETVAQRAFTVLGASIVERILAGGAISTEVIEAGEPVGPGTPLKTPAVPTPPAPEPVGPGVKAPRREKPENAPTKEPPMRTPGVPTPPAPEPVGPGMSTSRKDVSTLPVTTAVTGAGIAVQERPETLPAKCVVLDEFLAPPELEKLIQFAADHEAEFQASEVVSPTAEHGVVNYDHRRSRVLMDAGEHQQVLLERIQAVLPQVLEKLDLQEFSIAEVEAQITASNDGDFFHCHSDNGSERVASRYLTFVYFFHREPMQFEGGELRIHDARLKDGIYVSEGSYQTIIPRQNQIVFFPCPLMHEVTAVRAPSGKFADSRFTLNGWLRR